MVNAVIRWCLKNPFLMVLIVAGLCGGGYFAIVRSPVDAIPDIGEKQVIVYADWPGRSPQDVDDQVTFPLTTSLTGTPGVKAIRSMSGFGFSMVSGGRMRNESDLLVAIHGGAVKRIRPKTMTVATDMIGLLSLLWANGTGASVARRLVVPLIGGITISLLIDLLVYPVDFYSYKCWQLRHEGAWEGAQ